MGEINKTSCAIIGGGNTGIPACFANPSKLIGVILVSKNFVLTKAQVATTLLTTLLEATHAARSLRIYPLINFEELSNDATEDPSRQTLGYGRSVMIREGNYSWQYRYLDGGLCLHNQLRLFNNKKWAALFVDSDGLLIGTKSGTEDMKGIPLEEFYAEPWRPSNGSSEEARYTIMVQFKPEFINEKIAFVETQAEFDIVAEVKGLLNLKLESYASLNAGLVKVKVSEVCGGENLYDLYENSLDKTAAYVIKNKETGASIPVTSITKDASNKGFAIQLTTADANYPAVGGKLTIELAAPSVLKAAPVSMAGYEGSNVLEFTR
jgi:hypothetical protein